MKGKPFVPDVIAIPQLKLEWGVEVGENSTLQLHSTLQLQLFSPTLLRLRDANHLVDGDRFRFLAATP